MKSQVIKIRNIPSFPLAVQTISLKPTLFLIVLAIVGFMMIALYPMYSYFGATLIAIAIFALVMIPDKKIMEVTTKYLILYNCKDRESCRLVFWDEILYWQYISKSDCDELRIELVNHEIEKVQAFSRKKFTKYMKEYAKDKEVKGKR